jgi:hypothetical protein
MKWFPKECKVCLGTLVMPDGAKAADCINCGREFDLMEGKLGPYFSMRVPVRLS